MTYDFYLHSDIFLQEMDVFLSSEQEDKQHWKDENEYGDSSFKSKA